MSLTRKMLEAMGIEDVKIEQIIEAHLDTVNSLKADRDKYQADSEKLSETQEKLKEIDKLNTEIKELKDKNSKYEAIKKEYEDYKAGIDAKEVNEAKEKAYRALLKKVGISEKRIDSVMKVTDLSAVNLTEEGQIQDVEELESKMKEEWSDFIVTRGTTGAKTSNPPQNTGGKKTKEEILAIKDTSERQRAMAENHELFGF